MQIPKNGISSCNTLFSNSFIRLSSFKDSIVALAEPTPGNITALHNFNSSEEEISLESIFNLFKAFKTLGAFPVL